MLLPLEMVLPLANLSTLEPFSVTPLQLVVVTNLVLDSLVMQFCNGTNRPFLRSGCSFFSRLNPCY